MHSKKSPIFTIVELYGKIWGKSPYGITSLFRCLGRAYIHLQQITMTPPAVGRPAATSTNVTTTSSAAPINRIDGSKSSGRYLSADAQQHPQQARASCSCSHNCVLHCHTIADKQPGCSLRLPCRRPLTSPLPAAASFAMRLLASFSIFATIG
jgi:hypothetical protein